MGHRRSATYWFNLFGAAGFALAALVGCSGDDGSAGASGSNAVATVPVASGTATALTIAITGASINSAPVVNFSISDQNGAPVTGLTQDDLRFNIAKLVPNSTGSGSTQWQNYINRARSGAVQGTQERNAAGSVFTDHGDGTYSYTFATDITNPAANPCPATPCNDADGNPLDISYEPARLHRVTIQQGNRTYPLYNAVYDFVPAGGTAPLEREIVKTSSCNACHNELRIHGSRIETRLCVTCHNPGSWVAGTPNTTVDFKVMIHKIHMGEELPSVMGDAAAVPPVLPVPYKIGNADFSTVVFPMAGSSAVGELRHCTKCHDGADAATPEGDNWKNRPSIEACSSCHDNVYFDTPDPAKPYQTLAHPGGVPVTNANCLDCHTAGVVPVDASHDFPKRLLAASDRFKFTVVNATPTGPGSTPTITFKIEKDGVGIDYKSDPAFTAGGNSTLNVREAWSTTDINNAGSGQNYGQPATINLLTATVTPTGNPGEYTVAGNAIPVTATGSLRVFIDGHPAGDVTTSGTFTDRLQTKSVFKDFKITDATVTARRSVVDVAKCDKCHNRVALHGNNRNDEPGVCINCHNPNATDKSRRTGVGVDGKTEEAIDFKRMIHAIHAGQKDDPATTTVVEGHGFREKGIVVYGYGGSVNDFSDVRFPGILNDCSTCHITTSSPATYELANRWEEPSQSGAIQGSTVDTGASATDPADDLKISPTAAVCSSCHDSGTAQDHMVTAGGASGVGSAAPVTQAVLATRYETCSICHGPGKLADVKLVHGVK